MGGWDMTRAHDDIIVISAITMMSSCALGHVQMWRDWLMTNVNNKDINTENKIG